MSHVAVMTQAHLPPLPRDGSVGIGCIGAGFIMADCHLVAYRAAGLRRPRNSASLSTRRSRRSKRLGSHCRTRSRGASSET
jgi:hypothetical protein